MKIALFGGAFDPPHLGHSQVADYLLQNKLADEVWFVPVKHHPFEKKVTESKYRSAMLDLVLEELGPQAKIESFELESTATTYTANTLLSLQKKHPDHTFSWVIGSDNLEKLHTWGGPILKALETFTFWVYPRDGYPLFEMLRRPSLEEWLPEKHTIFPILGAPLITASSSEVKARLAKNTKADVSDLVLPSVAEYIKVHDLYT